MNYIERIMHVRRVAAARGVKVTYRGEYIHFYCPSGREIAVWYPDYPEKGRSNNTDEKQLDDAIKAIESGEIQ